MISKIIVAVDGSQCADRAFQSAAELAKATNSKLHVICVVENPVSMGFENEMVSKFEEFLENEARRLLSRYSTSAEEKYGLKADTIVSSGYPAKVIVDVAREKGADLVVVGSRGMSGVKEMFLGSMSHAVVRNSKVPVLVVR